ncbi:MAG: tetratricopeptide repeat protein [Anaerolineae bacterium]
MNEIPLAEYRQQIERAIERRRYREAIAHVRRVLEVYPKDVGGYWLAGKAMLEAGQSEHAADMFRRVLSADPEHLHAWVGMSELAKQREQLGAAIWYMERAFELATDNEMVARELRGLHGELEGSEPERLQLTQGALAKLYLMGDLLTRAITELRALIQEYPDRTDLKVSLAEALWRNGQRLEASEVCQEILEVQPYNLKANLILGEIWTSSGRPEGEAYLQQAEAVDPENAMAQELFGPTSPLPAASPSIQPLDYTYPPEGERPAWMEELGDLSAVEGMDLAETGEAMEAQIEIPVWLQEIAGEQAPGHPPAIAAPDEAPTALPEEAPPLGEPTEPEPEIAEKDVPEEGVLEWIAELGGEDLESEEEAPPSPTEEGAPPAPAAEDEIPGWLAEIGLEPPVRGVPAELAEEEAVGAPEPAEIPDWLADLAPPEEELVPETAQEVAPVGPWDEEEIPEVTFPTLEELEEAAPAEAAPMAEKPYDWERGVPVEQLETAGEPTPWLGVDLEPEEDDDLAWLEELAEDIPDEDEELLTEAESAARLAEILEINGPLEDEAPPEAPEELVAGADIDEGVMEKPYAEEPVPEEERAAYVEEPEAEGELPYRDETLTWLERLVREKEEDLLDRAELAEPEVPAEEEAPPVELGPPPVLEAPAAEVEDLEGPVQLEDTLPADVLKPVAAEEPAKELAEEGIPSAGEALGWLERLTEEERLEPVADLEGPAEPEREEALPAEEVLAEPESEAFGWTAFAEPPIAVDEVAEPLPPAPFEEALEPLQEPALAVEEPEELVVDEEFAPIEEVEVPVGFEEAEEPVPTDVFEEHEEWMEEEITPTEEVEAPVRFEDAEEPIPADILEEAVEVMPEPALEVEAPVAIEEAEKPVPTDVLEEAVEVLPEPALAVEEPEEFEPVAPFVVPSEEEAPTAVVEEEAVPFVEPVEIEVAAEEALVAEAFEDVEGFIASRKAHADAHAGDHESWLELGRLLWQADRRGEAVETYAHLIASGSLLDEIIPDLEDYVEQWPGADTKQALGDAYMKADRLTDALDMYRQAMAEL